LEYQETALNLIITLGYLGLGLGMALEFTGIPFPGEVALAFAGFMIWKGFMEILPAWGAALAGSWAGSFIAYMIGARLGKPFILRYGRYGGLTPERMQLAENWFAARRALVLLLGRFISGVRPMSSYLAGIAGMPVAPFVVLSFLGTALWCSTFLYLGLLLGANYHKVPGLAGWIGVLFLGLSLGLAGYFWLRRRRFKSTD
jgi:membrane protein DedA with SNARE-associated domain